MSKYEEYKKILNEIKTMADLNPLNVAGCEMSLGIIEELVKKAKMVKVGV